jgi:NitT/TauT family transport system permease protein
MRSMRPDRAQDQQITPTSDDVELVAVPAESLIPEQSRARWLLETWLPPIVAFLLGIGGWIALIRLTHTPPYLAPSPGDVVNSMRDNFGDLLTALWSTCKDACVGLALSAVLGIALSIVMAQSKLLERAIFPYATLSETIPIFAIAPLIDSIFSGGHTAIVVVTFIIAVFPMIANTSLGLSSVDPNLVNLFNLYNASRPLQLLYLQLPFAVPYNLAGLRVSSGLAIIGAIIGQVLLGNGGPADGGLGFEIQYAAHVGDWGLLGAAAVVAAVLGIVVFSAVGALSTSALRDWHQSTIQPEN